jgi:hypothetical protein
VKTCNRLSSAITALRGASSRIVAQASISERHPVGQFALHLLVRIGAIGKQMGCEDEGHVVKHRDALGIIWHGCDCGIRSSFDMAPEGICSDCDGACIKCGSSPARRHKVYDDNGIYHRLCDRCSKKHVLLVARLNGEFDLTTFEALLVCVALWIPAHLLFRTFIPALSGVVEGIVDFIAMGFAIFVAQHFALARLWRRGETLAEREAREREQAELARRKRIWFGNRQS